MRLSVLVESTAPALSKTASAASTTIFSSPRQISSVGVLRLSLTDRCNYRCVYCMPAEGLAWLPKEHLLSFEEIRDVVRAAVERHGIRRFKLTGGEPTLRRGLCDLVQLLRKIPGIDDLSLTTNGQRLEDLARPLRESGLNRVTVSIDSLRDERFKRITRTGDLKAVLRGLDAAEASELLPIKINCVTMRGVNDDELADFARLTLARALTVRFIEYMPLGDAALLQGVTDRALATGETGPAGGCGAQHRGDVFFSEADAREQIEAALGPLEPVERRSEAGVGPAKVFRLARGNPRGRIGFISAMSQPFCSTCNRLRLTADGILRSCLFDGGDVALRDRLREIGSSTKRSDFIADAMVECVAKKPEVHDVRGAYQMSQMGG